MEAINDFVLRIADFLFAWILNLPKDAALFVVAIGSSLILTGVRVWSTDQDKLRRCAADKKRLKQLMREAKQNKNKEAMARLRNTGALVGLAQFKQEGKPLLAAIVPLALLATWAFFRLEFHPPAAGEALTVSAYFPASAEGRLVHLVPWGESENGWIQEIHAVTDAGPEYGLAQWRVVPPAGEHTLRFRYAGQSYPHPARIGGRTYEPPLRPQDDALTLTEIQLQPVKLFGVVPGIPALAFAPWLVAYLLIVIPFVTVFKKLLRIQ